MQYKYKKKLYKILSIVILLGFIISLVGCDWFSLGLLNIFDPQAQIRVNYTKIDLTEGVITLEIYSINEVEFIGSGFEYEYYVGTTKIPGLSKTVGATFYVEPSTTSGTKGPITTIENLPLYFQEVQDYSTSHPLITEITCTIDLIGTDGAGHNITISVTFDLPALQPGIDFVPSTITLQAAPATVTSATGSSTIAATVKDAYGNPVADGTAVTFSSTYGTLSSTHTTTTDGIATTVLTFSAGDSSSTITATSGSVVNTMVVTYSVVSVSSTITLQAAPTIVTEETGSSTITATVKDAAGSPVVDGTAVTFSSNYGTLSSTYTTTTDGIATTTLTFSAGDSSSTVTATSGTVSATVGVTYYIASSPFITIFAADYSPAAGVPTTINAVVTKADGTPVANGTVVIFVTTKGTFTGVETTVQGVTAAGTATADLTLVASGDIAKVTATCGTRVSNEITLTCP
ncbi:MAG: hypothetical protein KAW42_05710 [Candidatus Atribacteria bacterium]|nr:hypothetical protein [Candidatus Atribacteria bacterium]